MTSWLKKTLATIQKRKRRLELQKEKELATIEKMYEHIEAYDSEEEKKTKAHEPVLVSGKSIIRFWVMGLLIVYLGYIAFNSLNIIYLILAAFIISMIIDAPIVYFSKKMSKGWAIALSYFLVLAAVTAILIFVLPFVFHQLAEAIKMGIEKINEFQLILKNEGLASVIENRLRLPATVKSYIINNIQSPDILASLQTSIQDNISQIITTGTSYATGLGSFAVKLVTGIFTTIFQAMMLFLLAIFFSSEKEGVINFISSTAGDKKNRIYVKLQKMYAKLGLWIKGQILVCMYVGAMLGLLYLLLSWITGIHIPSIGSLALLAGLTNFIPYIGPFIGMTAATFVTLVAGGWKAAALALGLYILVNQSENNILTPIIMNKTLGVSALLIFICMLLGGLTFGFIGILLAVPIAVILTMALEKDHQTKLDENVESSRQELKDLIEKK